MPNEIQHSHEDAKAQLPAYESILIPYEVDKDNPDGDWRGDEGDELLKASPNDVYRGKVHASPKQIADAHSFPDHDLRQTLSPVELGEAWLRQFNELEQRRKKKAGVKDESRYVQEKSLSFRDGFHTPYPVILVIHASVGSGHRSAAIAVAQALEHMRDEQLPAYPDGSTLDPNTHIAILDILAWGDRHYSGDKAVSMFTGASRPIYDLTWRYTFTGRLLWSGGTFLNYMVWRKFTRFIGHIKPQAVVATHIMGANMSAGARMICRQTFPLVCVPTDYETEGLWPHKACDTFCVATDAMTETLRARKIAESRIRITGIPVRQGFSKAYDRSKLRKEFDFPEGRQVIVMLAGAYLSQPYVNLRATIDAALPFCKDLANTTICVICGRDEAYEKRLQVLCEQNRLSNVRVMGYVDKMAELMCASDLIVCKSGGLTVTECLCAKSPMLLVGRAYGQEKINVNMLTSEGAAMHVTTPRELVDAIADLEAHPERIQAMLTNTNVIRRPHAADDVAKVALRLSTMNADQRHMWRPKRNNIFDFYIGNKPAHVR